MSDNNIYTQNTISVTVLSSHEGFIVVEQALECANCKSSCLLAQKRKSFTIKTNKTYEKGSHINIIVDEKSGKKKLLNKKLWLSQDKIVYNRLVELLGVENVVLK